MSKKKAKAKAKPRKPVPEPKPPAPSGELKICIDCSRDPRIEPAAEVVAKDRCAACYGRMLRRDKREAAGLPPITAPRRVGTDVRITVRMAEEVKVVIEAAAAAAGVPVSEWAAQLLEAGARAALKKRAADGTVAATAN